jgi:hypothetical protein
MIRSNGKAGTHLQRIGEWSRREGSLGRYSRERRCRKGDMSSREKGSQWRRESEGRGVAREIGEVGVETTSPNNRSKLSCFS